LVFEKFNKREMNTEDKKLNASGCGLGLALSNSLAKLLGPA
jgi:hypothetical protein